jgi:HAE1 family hydrophobic/amphiphilic exporter-1
MLMGIVAKNSILLADSAIVARTTRGLSCHEAVTDAARKRARPTALATVAMCAGMAHIAFGIGADSEFRSPMALMMIGGLCTSTLLSLVFVPAAYSFVDQSEGWFARWLIASRATQAERPGPVADTGPYSRRLAGHDGER